MNDTDRATSMVSYAPATDTVRPLVCERSGAITAEVSCAVHRRRRWATANRRSHAVYTRRTRANVYASSFRG